MYLVASTGEVCVLGTNYHVTHISHNSQISDKRVYNVCIYVSRKGSFPPNEFREFTTITRQGSESIWVICCVWTK